MSIQDLLPIIYIFGFFIVIMVFDQSINFFLRESFFGLKYRYFVAPGVIIHELSHALAALLTFHKVEKINFLDPNGGYVLHQKTREPISQVIISFAPIIGITISFYLITYLLQPSWLNINLHDLNSFQIILKTPLNHWQSWLHLYLATSLATCLAPSRQDFKVAIGGIIILILILLLLSFSRFNTPIAAFIEHSYLLAIFLLSFLILTLLISLIFYIITKLARY